MKSKGIIITLVLVFGGIFLLLLGGLLGFVLLQHRQSLQKVTYAQALEIAEAGVNYYRWHLAHAPSDFCDGESPGSGNCQASPYGPFEHDYKDPEGNVIGKFSLMITPTTGCDPATKIESTGWTSNSPNIKRKIQVKYSKPALAKYAFLTNSNVWFGPDEELKGPFHSNGGIRMDGIQNSLSTSAKETYICGYEHGCDPAQEKPGIWGEGEGEPQGLWQFPVPAIDFDLITQDLASLKEDAENFGIDISQPTDHGYHINFKADGTIDVFRVKKVEKKVWGWNGEDWVHESNDIETEEFFANYQLPTNCAPIFVENNVWVDGQVNGRVTLVAAKFPETPSKMRKIIINGNINYTNSNSVLGLISQSDILVPLYSADNLEIKAAMLAQKGHVFRYYYPKWSSEPYKTYAIRNQIRTYGSIITNTIWTFTWVDSYGAVVSGYRTTEMNYDSNLTYNPPPYFPTTGEYQFVSWEEL